MSQYLDTETYTAMTYTFTSCQHSHYTINLYSVSRIIFLLQTTDCPVNFECWFGSCVERFELPVADGSLQSLMDEENVKKQDVVSMIIIIDLAVGLLAIILVTVFVRRVGMCRVYLVGYSVLYFIIQYNTIYNTIILYNTVE